VIEEEGLEMDDVEEGDSNSFLEFIGHLLDVDDISLEVLEIGVVKDDDFSVEVTNERLDMEDEGSVSFTFDELIFKSILESDFVSIESVGFEFIFKFILFSLDELDDSSK